MWVFLNDAFFSIVKTSNSHPVGRPLLVRARRRSDLARYFHNLRIVETPERDYGFRCYASRDEVAAMLADQVRSLAYDNFKASVHKGDTDRKRAYGRVWQAMADFQLEPPYGGKWLDYMPPDEPLPELPFKTRRKARRPNR